MTKKILIVDDSPISRKMLRSCIAKEPDMVFFEAGDGLAGLNLFVAEAPDITFLDLTMPVMDGVQALEKMKQHNVDLPIIVSTADIQLKSITKVMEMGACLVIKKPPTKESVRNAMDKASECLRRTE